MKKILVLFLCLTLVFASSALAASLTTVEINQVVQSGDKLNVIFHAVDENDANLSGLTAEQVKLEMSGQVLETELQSAAEGIGYVFAVDISNSLNEEQFNSVKECLKSFVTEMGTKDQMALVTFGTEVTTVSDFTDNKNTLEAVVNGLTATDNATLLYAGTLKAVELAKRQNESLPIQRAVIVISDGEDYSDEASIAEVQNRAKEAGVPVYVLGVNTGSNSAALATLGNIARSSGGVIFNRDRDNLADGFSSIKTYLSGGYLLAATVPADFADGSERALILTVSYESFRSDDTADVRIRAFDKTEEKAESEETKETPVPEETETASAEPVEASAAPETTEPVKADEQPEETIMPVEETEETGLAKNSFFAKENMLYIGIGAFVLVAIGAALFLYFFLYKKKKQKAKPSALDKGYGDFGYNGGNGETGTVDLSSMEDTGTISLEDYSFGGGDIVLMDQTQGMSYTVRRKDRITIGRKDGLNDIVIRDSAVSGNHCEIISDGGRLYVKDCNSHNGTYVISNGLRYQADSFSGQEIQIGDEIDLGHTRLELTQA